MSDPFKDRPLPRAALLGAVALIGFTFVAITTGRVTDIGIVEAPQAEAVQSRDLLFRDRADGAVLVYEAGDEQAFDVLEPGTNGFVRGVMRGLARQRKLQTAAIADPVRLTLWDDGRLTLEDPSTGYLVGLEAFGPTNAGAFVRFLDTQRASN